MDFAAIKEWIVTNWDAIVAFVDKIYFAIKGIIEGK